MARSPLFGRRIHISGSTTKDIAVAPTADVEAARTFLAGLVRDLPEQRLAPGIFSIRQRPISAIGEGLDVDLRDLAALDRMQPAGRRGKTAKGAQDSDGIEITSVEDIRF